MKGPSVTSSDVVWAFVGAAALAATSSCSAPQRRDAPQPTESAPPVASGERVAPPASVEARYDVHEWGLVRAGRAEADTVRVGAVAPVIPPEVFIITKPVLYFRADAPLNVHRVAVRAPGGSVVETWPLAKRSPDGESYTWSDVSVDPLSPCKSSPLPGKADPPCSLLPKGDECESLGLASVRTVDASCVRVGDKTETFLFYRIDTSAIAPPLRFERQKDGTVRVENRGDEPIPGFVIRIDTLTAATHTITVRPPPPHKSLTLPTAPVPKGDAQPVAEDNEDGPGVLRPRTVTGSARDDLRATMRELGMADTEIDAFLKAWDETLFGSPSAGGFRPVKQGTSLLYFLPESTLERAAQVTFDPPPRSFRRAFAVWTELAPKP